MDFFNRDDGKKDCKDDSKKECKDSKINLTPANILVIGGILTGVLDVKYVLVDRDQIVQILLEGSLKQKTELEKMMEQIGSKPFNEVMKALLGRLQ